MLCSVGTYVGSCFTRMVVEGYLMRDICEMYLYRLRIVHHSVLSTQPTQHRKSLSIHHLSLWASRYSSGHKGRIKVSDRASFS